MGASTAAIAARLSAGMRNGKHKGKLGRPKRKLDGEVLVQDSDVVEDEDEVRIVTSLISE